MREQRNLKQTFSSFNICLLRLSVMIFKILGLAPFTIVVSSNDKSMMFYFVKSFWGRVYNCLSSFHFLFIMFMHLPYLNSSVILTIPTIQVSYEIGVSFCVNGVTMMIILIYGFTQQSAVLVLNRFINWNAELTKKLPNLQQLHQLQSGKCQQILITVSQIIISILLVISELVLGDDPKIYLLPLGLPGFIIECIIIQYTLIAIMLKKKFYDLNELLLLIGNSTNRCQFNTIVVMTESCNQKLIDDLIFIRNSLRILDEISRDFIDFFSLPALLAIMLTSVQLIYHSYFFIMLFFVSTPLYNSPSRYVNSFMWTIKDVYPIVILATIIIQIVTEMARTSRIIYRIMESFTTQLGIQYELEQFSVELLHRKVSFMVGRLFFLDGSLLKSIFYTMITYIVILFQVQRAVSTSLSDGDRANYPTIEIN